MQSLSTMKAIREYAEKNQEFKTEFMSSLSTVKESVSAVFQRLSLKGIPFKISNPASQVLIEELYSALQTMDASVTSASKGIQKHPAISKFMKQCGTVRKYFFMIKKCGQDPCPEGICKLPKLPREIFDTVHILRDPVPSRENADHYQTFDELYETTTSEKYCPSLQGAVNQGSDISFRVSAETARAVVKCIECDKPRLVYSQKKPTKAQLDGLLQLLENMFFVCGSGLGIPDDRPLCSLFAVQTNISCQTDVSYHYFSCSLKLENICYKCGSRENLIDIPPEEKKLYQSIHTVCVTCRSTGAIFRTRNKVKTAAKKSVGMKRPHADD